MRTRPSVAPLLLLLSMPGLGACGSSDGIGNAEHRRLVVNGTQIEGDPATRRLLLWIVGRSGDTHECPVAKPDLQGTVNGVAFTVDSLGSDEDWGPCDQARLSGPWQGPGPLDVRVWDSTGAIEASFATGPFDERSLTFVEPTDGRLHFGDRVVVRYAPASDDIVESETHDLGFRTTEWKAPLTHEADLLSFVVPEVRRSNIDETSLAFDAAFRARTTSCQGADECSVSIYDTPRWLPVTLVWGERGAPACYQCRCTYEDGSQSHRTWMQESGFVPVHCSSTQCGANQLGAAFKTSECVASTPAEVNARR
jgi:hypothetical protein